MLIKASTRKGKRFMAIFKNGTITHFGLKNGSSFIDHGDEVKRQNYIARHATEDWTNPYTPASLSRYLTWGNHKTLEANHQEYMKKFDKIINK
jgi:hypothetical protein